MSRCIECGGAMASETRRRCGRCNMLAPTLEKRQYRRAHDFEEEIARLAESKAMVTHTWWSNHRPEAAKVGDAYISLRSRCAKYGLRIGEWAYLVASQKSCCAICSVPLEPLKLCIDHDHQTNAVRGLLCTSCNTGLGHLGIDGSVAKDRAESVIAYIRRHVTARSISTPSVLVGNVRGDAKKPA